MRSPLAGVAALSVVHPQAFHGLAGRDLAADCARLLGTYGMDTVELAVPGTPDTPPHPRWASLRMMFESRGVRPIVLGGLALLAADASLSAGGQRRDEALRIGRWLVEQALQVGAGRVLVTSGPDLGPGAREQARARLVATLVELDRWAADRAETAGVERLRIVLEPTDRGLEHRQLVGPTEEALEVVAEAASRGAHVGLNLDLSHLLQLGEDPAVAVRQARPWCDHVHLANCVIRDPQNPWFGDRHPPFGTPGSEVGIRELAAFLGALAEAGYLTAARSVVVGVEVRPAPGADPWWTLTEAMSALDAAWSGA